MADSVKIRITGDDSSYRKTLSGLGSAARTAVKGLTVAAAAVSAAWSAVGVVGVRYNAQIEQLQTSFEVMTGSAEKGAEVLERIRQIAAATPFETEGLASTVQLLMNYNLTAEEAISSMTMLGDIAQGDQEKLSRIAMAYGQMSSAGKVTLEDVKQMIEAGFNPLAEISETTGESMASLYDRISDGKVAVDEITQSMVRSTSEGGKYFQSMEKQSQTLNGQLSTLKDNAMSLLGDVMTPLTDSIRDELLPMANNLLGEFATAFGQGGFDGLLDAVTGKIPDLLNAALEMGEKVISGLAKWLPGAMQQIASVLPNALRSVLDMGPQLISALFDIVSSLVRDLITMLPELVPMIIEGIGNLIPAILNGIGDVLTGLFEGIDQAFHQGMTKIAGVWVDNEGIEAINVGLEADIDVSSAEDDIASAYATVRAALQTDLLTDDQRQQIVDMIGQDYDTVKAALLSFGLTEEEAAPIAEAISSVGAALQTDLLTDDQRQQIVNMIGQDYDTIKAALLSFGLTEEEAEPIAEAISSVGEALQTDLLTDDQRQQIVDMIGQDYDTIKAALLSFGLTEEEAEPIAEAISSVGEDIAAAWDGVAIGADGATIAKWVIQSEGSRLALRTALENAGLSQDDITAILGQFDATASQLGNGAPDLFTRVYDALTDGLPDTPGQTDAFVEEANAYYDGMIDQIDADLEDSIAALDPDSPDYADTVAELTAGADAAKAEAENLRAEVVNFITNMSGKSTAEVEAAFSDLEELERRTAAVRGELDAANAEANTAAGNAFEVVRSGAIADQETIGLAINFKATEYKLDEQSAQDAYDAAVGELNAQLANNEITAAEYNEQRLSAEATRDAAIKQARAEYERAFAEIIRGIAESEGNEAALQDALEATNAQSLISDFMENMFTPDGTAIDIEAAERVNDAIVAVLGDAFNSDNFMRLVKYDNPDNVYNFLQSIAAQIDAESSDSLSKALGGKVGEAYSAALESGVLAGTSFDTSDDEEQIVAILGAIFDSGAQQAGTSFTESMTAQQDTITGAAETSVSGVADATDVSAEISTSGSNTAEGWISGFNSRVWLMKLAASAAAKAITAAFNSEMGISSPSKVFRQSGRFTGEGFILGYEDSIREAQRTVRGLTGGLISAANFPARNAVTVTQGAVYAADSGDDLSRLNVGLYISDRKIAEATADANSRVSNARTRRMAAGWGHV